MNWTNSFFIIIILFNFFILNFASCFLFSEIYKSSLWISPIFVIQEDIWIKQLEWNRMNLDTLFPKFCPI